MASRKRRSSGQAPGWAWMLFGLSIGLVVALVVYLVSGDGGSGPPATATSERSASTPSPESTPARAAPRTAETGAGGSAEAGAESEADEEFSFFRLLPESEVVVPGDGPPTARSAAGPAQEYIIQAGSYIEWAEADRAQARLALIGIESKLERAIVGNEVRHRVIIGPLSDRAEIEATVRRLNAERIDSMPPRPVGN